MKTSRLTFAALLLIASASLALAQGTYTQIDEPNAVYGTYLEGIDGAGDIVGYYLDGNNQQHGFLLSGGAYTTIDYPGFENTDLYGVNDRGQIVGFTLAPPAVVGFLYDIAAQTFTTISYPHSSDTFPFSINDSGTIVGFFTRGSFRSGFALTDSTYVPIEPPNAPNSYAFGISASGEIAGDVMVGQTYDNFLFRHGRYSRITIPGAPAATLYGINGVGTALVGLYEPTSDTTAGFLYENKTLQELQFPGAGSTIAMGVNNAGTVVGWFFSTGGIPHGFTWTPPADAGKK